MQRNHFIPILEVAIAITFWALSFIYIKIALQEMSAWTLIVLRYFLGFVLLFGVTVWRGELRQFQRSDLKVMFWLGLIGIALQQLLQVSGQVTADASVAAFLASSAPAFMILFAALLLKEPVHKWLVVCPSISPENAPAGHRGSSISAGTTMDNQLLFDLFTKTIKVAEILKTDNELRNNIKNTLKRLPPMQVGQWGQLQEWMQDLDRRDDKHRHVSHLYGLFPSGQISPYSSPELFAAARTSLKRKPFTARPC